MKNGADPALNYTYDKNGNIETISSGTELKHKYYYDTLNQLVREDDKDRNMTITYDYDEGGNILSKSIYPYTTETTLNNKVETVTYSYENENWKDQLTSYNGKAITYDTIGNPLTYNGNTYTWQNGRQLAGIENAANNLTVTYKYNDSGIRTEKTVNGVTTKYYLNGSKVIYEKTGDNISYYTYDESGNVLGIKYNDNQYYYKKNLQGDIIGLLDSSLEEVVKYSYDSWGNTLSIADGQGEPITDETHIGHINPYRYRGYRYDKETGLYYLQSRYYSAQWGRFVNGDILFLQNNRIIGNNLYQYCYNNPVNNIDVTGKFPGPISWVAKKMWGVVCNVLDKIGMNLSAELLRHSTKNKPEDLHYDGNSNMAKKIKEDNVFKERMEKIVKENRNSKVEIVEVIQFDSTDLQGSLNNCTLKINGKLTNGKGKLKVKIHDTYDFDLKGNYFSGIKGFIFTIGNNMAWSDQFVGVVNNYEVYIEFDYEI